MNCDRCGEETWGVTGSWFTDETICLERCDPAERAHPLYEVAKRVETMAVLEGNYRYPGIGLPDDLKVR